MLKRYYTSVLMPPDGDTRSYVLGRWPFRLLVALAALVLVGLVGSVGWNVWLMHQRQSMDALLTELQQDNEQKTQDLEKVRQDLDKLQELSTDINKVLFDDTETGGLGQGGFEAGDFEDVAPTEISMPRRMTQEVDPSSDVVEYADFVAEQVIALHTSVDQQRSLYNGFPSILPIETASEEKTYWFSSGYGYRVHPLTGVRQFHRGLDIATRLGTPVIATAEGVVESIVKDPYLGRVVKLRHQSFQGEHTTIYGHMKAFAEGLKEGDRVKRRQIIGYVGRSGRTTGSHLHYEVHTDGRAENPMRFIIRDTQGRIH